MLDVMRKHAKSRFIKFLLYAVALSFVIGFGAMGYVTQSGKGQETKVIASVNGTDISYYQFRNAVANIKENVRNMYGDRADDLMQYINPEKQAIEGLIQSRLLADEARAKGITVSDYELQQTIYGSRQFQDKNGKFDKGLYINRIRRGYGMSPEEFEEMLREQMAVDNLRLLVASSAKVSDSELWGNFMMANDKVSLGFMKFTKENLIEEVQVGDDEIKQYFDEHKSEFAFPEKREVELIEIPAADFRDEIAFTDEEMESWYESNKERLFKVDDQVKASHILIKVNPEDPQAVKDAAKALAEKIQKQAAKEGADFGALAAKYSQDDSNKDKGGDLGWFDRKKMVGEFSDAAFSMAPGQVSGLVETMYGFHIIKVFETREGGYTPIVEAADQIKEALARSKTIELAESRAKELYNELSPGDSLADLASKKGLTLKTPPAFDRKGPLADVSDSGFRVITEAFKLNQGEIAQPIVGRSNAYLVKLLEIEPEREAIFDEVEEDARVAVLKKKAADQLGKTAEQARLELAAGGEKAAVAAKYNVTIDTTGRFTKSSYGIPKLGSDQDLLAEAFALTLEEPVAKKVYPVRNEQVVVWLEEKIASTQSEFEKQKETLRAQVLRKKQQELFDAFLAEAESRAKIVTDEEFLSQFAPKQPDLPLMLQ